MLIGNSVWAQTEANKTIQFTQKHLAVNPHEGCAVADLNGDGREDVLCEIGWYERPAGDIFAKPWKLHSETNLNHMHPSCPFIAKDLNKDGRNDIVATSKLGLWVFINQGHN